MKLVRKSAGSGAWQAAPLFPPKHCGAWQVTKAGQEGRAHAFTA